MLSKILKGIWKFFLLPLLIGVGVLIITLTVVHTLRGDDAYNYGPVVFVTPGADGANLSSDNCEVWIEVMDVGPDHHWLTCDTENGGPDAKLLNKHEGTVLWMFSGGGVLFSNADDQGVEQCRLLGGSKFNSRSFLYILRDNDLTCEFETSEGLILYADVPDELIGACHFKPDPNYPEEFKWLICGDWHTHARYKGVVTWILPDRSEISSSE